MKKFRVLFASLGLMIGLTAPLAAPMQAQAVDIYRACGTGAASSVCASKGEKVNGFVKNLVNTLLYIIGALAVVMIIVGAIRYTASAGNSSQTTAAKNTILYAVVGLALAIFAFAIVNFVIVRSGIE